MDEFTLPRVVGKMNVNETILYFVPFQGNLWPVTESRSPLRTSRAKDRESPEAFTPPLPW